MPLHIAGPEELFKKNWFTTAIVLKLTISLCLQHGSSKIKRSLGEGSWFVCSPPLYTKVMGKPKKNKRQTLEEEKNIAQFVESQFTTKNGMQNTLFI
jgi:hypothetical protein